MVDVVMDLSRYKMTVKRLTTALLQSGGEQQLQPAPVVPPITNDRDSTRRRHLKVKIGHFATNNGPVVEHLPVDEAVNLLLTKDVRSIELHVGWRISARSIWVFSKQIYDKAVTLSEELTSVEVILQYRGAYHGVFVALSDLLKNISAFCPKLTNLSLKIEANKEDTMYALFRQQPIELPHSRVYLNCRNQTMISFLDPILAKFLYLYPAWQDRSETYDLDNPLACYIEMGKARELWGLYDGDPLESDDDEEIYEDEDDISLEDITFNLMAEVDNYDILDITFDDD
ncbi:uncharacterized protein LOC135941675 [Cloeon dipterum]|uniref:uncharacterized protein LOC135941675 n=1 Tax=Cloeon dipterum TaxID=197152 RepID=UPI00322068B3